MNSQIKTQKKLTVHTRFPSMLCSTPRRGVTLSTQLVDPNNIKMYSTAGKMNVHELFYLICVILMFFDLKHS